MITAEPPSIRIPTGEAIQQELARRSLYYFADYMMWDDIAGRSTFVHGKHVREICGALEEVERGEIDRLMIFAPPRHMKSLSTSQLAPAWFLGKDPRRRIVQTGYGDAIAVEHSRKCRDYFLSRRFNALFPEARYQATRETQSWLAPPKQSAHEWGTTQGGGFRAVGIGGALTGYGADILNIDDPIKNRKDADSKTYRDNAWNWYRSVARTRLTPNGAIVLTTTRWHRDDLAGRLLKEMREGGEQWKVLEFKAITQDKDEPDERKRYHALWPEFWPLEKLRALERGIGPREWEALYQQNPTEEGGTIFKREWWTGKNRYKQPMFTHSNVGRILSWDTAEKIGEDNAYSACGAYELSPAYKMGITDLWRDKVEFPGLVKQAIDMATKHNRDGKLRAIVIEEKSSGTALIQTLQQQAPEWIRKIVHAAPKTEGKVLRAHTTSTYCHLDAVFFPEPSEAVMWLGPFEDELYSFPGSVFKDQVDQFTQAIWYWENYLASGLGIQVMH